MISAVILGLCVVRRDARALARNRSVNLIANGKAHITWVEPRIHFAGVVDAQQRQRMAGEFSQRHHQQLQLPGAGFGKRDGEILSPRLDQSAAGGSLPGDPDALAQGLSIQRIHQHLMTERQFAGRDFAERRSVLQRLRDAPRSEHL